MTNCAPRATACCTPRPNLLQCILDLLRTWYNAFVARFTSAPAVYSRQVGWTVTRVVNNTRTRVTYYSLFNNTGSAVYVKLYNKVDDTFDPLTTAPFLRLLVPANSGENVGDCNIILADGLAIRVTTGIADTDEAYPADNTVIVNVGWKS